MDAASDRQSPLERALPVVVIAACVVLFLEESATLRAHYDDSYITYRYARNLARGNGLVYNLGEYVEGFTNLLWTLLIAAGIRLGFAAPGVAHVLGVLCAIATLLAAYWYSKAILPKSQAWMAALTPCILLALAPFSYCSTNGMETPLFMAAVTAALAAQAWQHIAVATLFAGLATLTRPDGALVAATVFAAHFYFASPGTSLVKRLAPIVPYGALVLALTLFRLAYYGSPVPNTFYAKVGGLPITLGLRWALSFLAQGFFFWLPSLSAPFYSRDTWAGSLFVILNLVFLAATASTGARFILPMMPVFFALAVGAVGHAIDRDDAARLPLSICLAAGFVALVFGNPLAFVCACALAVLATLGSRPRATIASGVAVLALLATTWAVAEKVNWRDLATRPLSTSHRNGRIRRLRTQDRAFWGRWHRKALDLRERESPSTLVAAGAIGSLGYYSELPILDYLGLVDTTVATSTDPVPENPPGVLAMGAGHQRSNASYILARRPEVLLIPKKGAELPFYLPAVIALWAHPDLERCYTWDEELDGYRRRCDDADSLPARG